VLLFFVVHFGFGFNVMMIIFYTRKAQQGFENVNKKKQKKDKE
jgi:hypothetical protein